MRKEKTNELWGCVETPLQAQILTKVVRTASLMNNDTPYYRGSEKGVYEVTPDGKAVSPLVLAIICGAPATTIKLLLQEEERRIIEWRNKQGGKDELSPNNNKDVVV